MKKNFNDLVITILFVCLSISCFCSCSINSEYFIFSDIHECYNLELNRSDDAEIERYETPAKDKQLKGLEYKEFYGMKYSSSAFDFEIFAYEFSDLEQAKQYYKGIAKDINENNFDGGISFGAGEIHAIQNEKVYIVYTEEWGTINQVHEYINKCFTVNIRDN